MATRDRIEELEALGPVEVPAAGVVPAADAGPRFRPPRRSASEHAAFVASQAPGTRADWLQEVWALVRDAEVPPSLRLKALALADAHLERTERAAPPTPPTTDPGELAAQLAAAYPSAPPIPPDDDEAPDAGG